MTSHCKNYIETIGSKISQQQGNCKDKFYLMFEWEIQIWPKVFAKKSNDAMYQDEDPGRGLLSLQNILPKLTICCNF